LIYSYVAEHVLGLPRSFWGCRSFDWCSFFR
jgi:hypothetical protein